MTKQIPPPMMFILPSSTSRDWPFKLRDVEPMGDETLGKETDLQKITNFKQLGYSFFVGLSHTNTISFAEPVFEGRILKNEVTVTFGPGDALVFTDYTPHTGEIYAGKNGEPSYKLFASINARGGESYTLQRWFDTTPTKYWLRYSPSNTPVRDTTLMK